MTHHRDATHAPRTTPPPMLRAAIAGLSVALWYAAPDFVHRRGLRALAKTAILGGAAIAFARGPAAPATTTATGNPEQDQLAAPGAPGPSSARDRWRNADPRLLIGVGGPILLAGIGLNVATERWIHRFGDRLARSGALLPHTAIGLVAGSLAVLAGLNEQPDKQRSARPGAGA